MDPQDVLDIYRSENTAGELRSSHREYAFRKN